MIDTEFQTYWLCNGVKTTSEHAAIQRALTGAVVCEITAEMQAAKAARQEQRHRQAMANLARIQREALRREYERSPAGQRDSTLRFAAETPGGRVTVASVNENSSELDRFGRDATNMFKQ